MELNEAEKILNNAGYLLENDTDDKSTDYKIKEIIIALTNNGWKFLKNESNLKLIKLVFVSKKTHRWLVVQDGHRKNTWSFWIKEDGDTLKEWDFWDISLKNVSIEKIKNIYPNY